MIHKKTLPIALGTVAAGAAAYGLALVFDPAHFIMERKMMLGIKRRAEERLPGLAAVA